METKSGQLQIRVTPAEKAALKRLAADAGQSLSAFVLSRALPPGQDEVTRRVRALGGGKNLPKALSDLRLHLQSLSGEEFDATVAGIDRQGLTPLQANCAAAAVEGEAWRRGRMAPEWTQAIDPLDRPYFGWGLPSLRPHLMRVTPATLKRRNVYLADPEDDRR